MMPEWIVGFIVGFWASGAVIFGLKAFAARKLRFLLEEAACLQAVNRRRERLKLPVIYNSEIDKYHPYHPKEAR